MKLSLVFVTLVALLGAYVSADEGHPVAQMPKEFDMVKNLVGTWEGSNKMGDKQMPMTVTYELTSGGTAVAERLAPGTSHEMLTVYHKEGNSLGVTHFCAMGNAPQMHLKKAEAGMLAFEMTKPLGISSMKENHMHAVTLKMTDADTLTQEWVNYDGGKQGQVMTFNFKRKK